MKTEKTCPRCKRLRPISNFVDISGKKNPFGKYCINCHEDRQEEFLREELKEEKSYIPKLRIIYGRYWKHYAGPYDFRTTLFHERDFCPYCGVKLDRYSFNEKKSRYEILYHIDHMDPLELGGEDSIRNAVFCCSNCNTKKGTKPFLSWLKHLTPKYKKIAKAIYIEKQGHPPEEFKKGFSTSRTAGLNYELMLDEDELREMYPKPIADGPPSEETFTITISLDDVLKRPKIQKLIREINKYSKR